MEDKKFKLNEYDFLEIIDANIDNLPVYKILVIIDDSNPMRTVSGIQIFTSLRDIALVLKTIPDFDEIYSDNFYKEIMYIIATNLPLNKIKEYLIIPDTTKDIFIERLNLDNYSKSNIVDKVEKKDDKNIDEEFDETSGDDVEESEEDNLENVSDKEEFLDN